MPTATLHDGSRLEVEIEGEGPALLVAVNPTPIEGETAEEMRRWGADPALGRTLIESLREIVTVVAFDYEGQVLVAPKPDTLTPANITADFLAIADAAGAATFAYYGYSWLALSGLQLAIRTNRLSALIMGGWTPLGGPYAEMLEVTAATHRMASENNPEESTTDRLAEPGDWSSVEVTMSEAQTRQFLTMYRSLQTFDEHQALTLIDCPRLCFVGSEDEIVYDERWGGVRVNTAEPLQTHRGQLEASGWTVHLLDQLDHTQAMQAANVLPVIRPWLRTALHR